jgi:acyl-CoA reductase-like NAD-dependent aldehyde dehydrogenase
MSIAMTVGGMSVPGANTMPVEDPAQGTPFAEAPRCDRDDLRAAVAAASAAFPGWAACDEDDRRSVLLACGAALLAGRDEIADLLTAEQGKPLRDARAEVDLAAHWFAHSAELSLRPERLVDEPATQVSLTRVPIGPVAAIAPSNFPIILSVTKIAPALLAGNTVVLKPSPLTPLSSLRMTELLAEVLPAGVLNTVSGGHEVGAWLSGDPAIGLVSFTGSVAAGREIARTAAATFRRVVLELGGNDACIVLPDADVPAIAADIFRRATINSGQFCAAIKRIYVSQDQERELVESLRALAESVVVGDGRDPATDLGPLVSHAQRDRVVQFVDEALRAGARVVTGGTPPPRPGYFYPPTVVTDLPGGTALEEDEQFGPVIPVIAYTDVEDAVRRSNATPFGLGASVWGEPTVALRVGRELVAGTVWINTHGDLRHDVPFGGVRCSGVGVEYGWWGLLEYTNLRVVHAAGPAGRIQ